MARIPQEQITEDDALTSFTEAQLAEWAASLSGEQVSLAIAYEWNRLQQIPSYIQEQIERNRGLIESIASQH